MTEGDVAVGYINCDERHVLISIRNPTLTSECPRPDFTQVAITIEAALDLQARLADFLEHHRAPQKG
jgi:hypothetical protein